MSPKKLLRLTLVLGWVYFLQFGTANTYATVDEYGLRLNRLNRIATNHAPVINPYIKPEKISYLIELNLNDNIILNRLSKLDLDNDSREIAGRSVSSVLPGAAEDLAARDAVNHSRHPPRGYTNTYVDGGNVLEVTGNEVSLQRHREQLAADALDIVNSGLKKIDRERTTSICVALRDSNGVVKKFTFHSGEHAIHQAMYDAANRKGYDVVQAERSHAEGQLIQFLLRNPNEYTHVVGIGCSRLYCIECDCLFRLFLGSDWTQACSSVLNTFNGTVASRAVTGGSLSTALNGSTIYRQDIRESNSYYVNVREDSMIDRNRCRLYRLPLFLREKIEFAVGHRLSFEGDRF